MLTELDGKAVERAGVQPLKESTNNELCAQIEPLDLVNDFRFQVLFYRRHDRSISGLGCR